MRTKLPIVLLIAGLVMVAAAILLLLAGDIPAPVAAALGVPGLGFIAASRRSRG